MRSLSLKKTILMHIVADLIAGAVKVKGFSFREKDTWQSSFLRRNNLYEKRLNEIVSGYLKSLKKHVLENIIKAAVPHKIKTVQYKEIMQWEFNRDIWDQKINELIKTGMKNIVETEGQAVTKRMQRLNKFPVNMRFDVFNPNVTQFCEKYAYSCATSVNSTISSAIRSTILSGMEQGSSVTEIRNGIEAIFDDRIRAEMIARTESIRASNYGAIESYRQSGVVEYKEWLITDDDRTCELCSAMNGLKISINGNYNAKAEELGINLSYGDIEAPPLHPQCRCCLIPGVIEFDE
jgi:SPP1 gp7 family putative phage head morphogenesis protein